MYEVEWVAHIPLDEIGDPVLDESDVRRKYRKTFEAAEKYARRVFHRDQFGAVGIRECHEELIEPGCPLAGTYIEYDGDAVFIHEEDLRPAKAGEGER